MVHQHIIKLIEGISFKWDFKRISLFFVPANNPPDHPSPQASLSIPHWATKECVFGCCSSKPQFSLQVPVKDVLKFSWSCGTSLSLIIAVNTLVCSYKNDFIVLFGHMCNFLPFFFTILKICTMHFFFFKNLTHLCWMLCFHFCSPCSSSLRHSWGISEPPRPKWAGCPELTNPVPFLSPVLFSVYFTHEVLRKHLTPHSSKAPVCPENYKPASIPILIPSSRFCCEPINFNCVGMIKHILLLYGPCESIK